MIVGNEPNLNRFWMPQFAADGSGASAPAYLELLAADVRRAEGRRAGHRRLRRRARAERRRQAGHRPRHDLSHPVHPRARARPTAPAGARPGHGRLRVPPLPRELQPPPDSRPDADHVGLADYDKLVGLLGEAFDGTAQPGSTLPILYDEFGVESVVPAAKSALYTGTEPATTRRSTRRRRPRYYRRRSSSPSASRT